MKYFYVQTGKSSEPNEDNVNGISHILNYIAGYYIINSIFLP